MIETREQYEYAKDLVERSKRASAVYDPVESDLADNLKMALDTIDVLRELAIDSRTMYRAIKMREDVLSESNTEWAGYLLTDILPVLDGWFGINATPPRWLFRGK